MINDRLAAGADLPVRLVDEYYRLYAVLHGARERRYWPAGVPLKAVNRTVEMFGKHGHLLRVAYAAGNRSTSCH